MNTPRLTDAQRTALSEHYGIEPHVFSNPYGARGPLLLDVVAADCRTIKQTITISPEGEITES